MQPRKLIPFVVAAALLLPSQALAQEAIRIKIAPIRGGRVTGSGTMAPGVAADQSTLTIQLEGLAPGAAYAVTQHHGASCADYEAAPELVFDDVTADSQGKAAARIAVKKRFANWPCPPHMEIFHSSADPASPAIACGAGVVSALVVPAQLPRTGAPPLATLPVLGGLLGLAGLTLVRRHRV